jgi:transposase
MKRERRKFSNAFKTEVVLEALKDKLTLAELSEKYKLYPALITNWKNDFLTKAGSVFGADQSSTVADQKKQQELEEDLYAQIGRLRMENEWLKKKLK